MKNKRSVFKNPLFWLKGILFSCFFSLLYLFFSDSKVDFYENNRIVNMSEVNILSLKYLWGSIDLVDVAILTFITAIILMIFIHVILIYQNSSEKDQYGH